MYPPGVSIAVSTRQDRKFEFREASCFPKFSADVEVPGSRWRDEFMGNRGNVWETKGLTGGNLIVGNSRI